MMKQTNKHNEGGKYMSTAYFLFFFYLTLLLTAAYGVYIA